MENPVDLIAKIKAEGGFFEVWHKKFEYLCHRQGKDGVQTVTVTILDAGPARPDSRYYCAAESEDGKIAVGNPDPTVDLAISGVHWENLDR